MTAIIFANINTSQWKSATTFLTITFFYVFELTETINVSCLRFLEVVTALISRQLKKCKFTPRRSSFVLLRRNKWYFPVTFNTFVLFHDIYQFFHLLYAHWSWISISWIVLFFRVFPCSLIEFSNLISVLNSHICWRLRWNLIFDLFYL